MADKTFLETYGADLLPGCSCFQDEGGGEVSEVAIALLSVGSAMGEMVAGNIMMHGSCPTAAPSILAVVVTAAAYHLAMSHPNSADARTAYEIMGMTRQIADETMALINRHQTRTETLALDLAKTQGAAGTC